MTHPDVTVVVISYNDVARLPRAIRSVQRQTLRAIEIIVVDDASSDDTEAVVRAIAAVDPRVRYERLPENSGGCSAPRNRGIELASAPWVMFCDSDDEYERHACKNLVVTAEETGADVVCGTAARIDIRTGRAKRWRPEVHDELRVVEGLQDLPELLYDTISVNKIYRVDMLQRNGIRFPEGLLFEDQLFTLEAMAAAPRLAVIPETVYRWYVDRVSEEPSITQRRNEARNVESRIEVNRRIDAFLADRSLTRIKEVKDLKFLRHDLYLYLASMLEVDDDTAGTLIDRLVPYVEQVDLSRAWELRPGLRVAIYHLLVRDLEGIRSAMRFIKWASVVDAPIVARDGRERWACPHADAGPDVGGVAAGEWLDVTELHLLTIPFTQRRYLHRLESIAIEEGRVVAHGSTFDYDGSLATADAVELRYLINGDRTVLSVPTAWTGWDGPRRRWRAEGPATEHLRRRLEARDRGTLGIAVLRGEHANVVSARAAESEVAPLRLDFPGRTTWTGPDTIELAAHENGAVGWRAIRVSAARARADRARAAWFRVPGATRLGRLLSLVRRDAVPAVLTRVAHLLPRRGLAVFEVDGGRAFGGNARALSDGLSTKRPGYRQAWIYRHAPDRVPAGAEAVERLSLRHVWLAARADAHVGDGPAPSGVRRGAAVVNAGQGVPVHRIGLDDPSVLVSRTAVAAARRSSRSWTALVAPSEGSAEIVARAFGYRGRTIAAGLPRIDAAVLATSESRDDLRRRLDLPPDRAIVMYAPTARRGDRVAADPLLDLESWAAAVGDRAYLLLRPPPGEAFAVPTRLRFAVRDLGSLDVLAPFIAAADLVISDYSSIIGDAALIDRPIVLFQPDRETYVNRTRGVYAGLDEVGPVHATTRAVIDEVGAWLADPDGWDARHGPGRRAWASGRCGPADGDATARAVDAIWGGRR